VDVELARPEPVSVDTAAGLAGLAVAAFGAYRLFTAVGTTAGVEGWALLALGWVLVFPRLFLDLDLTADAVEVSVLTGKRRVPHEEITGVRIVDGRLAVRWFGVGASGYHSGNFHLTGNGHVKAYASRFAGPFVLVERGEDRPVLVSPAQPDAFVDAVRERSGLA